MAPSHGKTENMVSWRIPGTRLRSTQEHYRSSSLYQPILIIELHPHFGGGPLGLIDCCQKDCRECKLPSKGRYELHCTYVPGTHFFAFHGKFTNYSILVLPRFLNFFLFRKYEHLKANWRIAGKKTTKEAEHRAGARWEPCAPYHPSPPYGIYQGHPQRHSQAI